MKHLFHKISLTILSVLFASFLTIAYIPVNAESPSSGITVTITEDDMRAITNSTNATTEIKDIIVTSSGLAVFGYEGIPGSEPRPKLSVVHTSETHGVDTLKFKSTLGNITKIEISAGGVTVGVDVNYQTPAG